MSRIRCSANHLLRAAGLLTGVLIGSGTIPTMAAENLQEGMAELADKIVESSKAQENQSIAIMPFRGTDDSITELSNFMADELVMSLFNVPDSGLGIVERSQLEQIFNELSLSLSGAIDNNSIKKVGELAGVDGMVIGSITNLGERLRINARMIDTETAFVYAAAATSIPKTATISNLLSRPVIVNPAAPRTAAGNRPNGGGAQAAINQPGQAAQTRVADYANAAGRFSAEGFSVVVQAVNRTEDSVTAVINIINESEDDRWFAIIQRDNRICEASDFFGAVYACDINPKTYRDNESYADRLTSNEVHLLKPQNIALVTMKFAPDLGDTINLNFVMKCAKRSGKDEYERFWLPVSLPNLVVTDASQQNNGPG